MDTDYTDDLVLLANTPTQAKSLLHSLVQAVSDFSHHVYADKTKYMCFNHKGDISTLNGGSLKLVDKFTYLRSSISSIQNDISMHHAKACTAINRLSDLSDKIKCNFFQAVEVYREKAGQELHKNASSYIEPSLAATSNKSAAIWPPMSHY